MHSHPVLDSRRHKRLGRGSPPVTPRHPPRVRAGAASARGTLHLSTAGAAQGKARGAAERGVPVAGKRAGECGGC